MVTQIKNQNILDGTTPEIYRAKSILKIFEVCKLTPKNKALDSNT